MPTYELVLMLKVMPRIEKATVLKRIATQILDGNGAIRSIANIGQRTLPYRLSAHNAVHKEGHGFVFTFDYAPWYLKHLTTEFALDVDVIRQSITRVQEPEAFKCTLEEELQPPAYRKDVQKMLEIEKRAKKRSFTHIFKYNSGLDYYPFQK